MQFTRKDAMQLYGGSAGALAIALGLDVTTVHHMPLDRPLRLEYVLRLALLWPVEMAPAVAELMEDFTEAHAAALRHAQRRGLNPAPPAKSLL